MAICVYLNTMPTWSLVSKFPYTSKSNNFASFQIFIVDININEMAHYPCPCLWSICHQQTQLLIKTFHGPHNFDSSHWIDHIHIRQYIALAWLWISALGSSQSLGGHCLTFHDISVGWRCGISFQAAFRRMLISVWVEICQALIMVWIKFLCIWTIQILLKYLLNGAINDKPAWIQTITWHRTCDTSLSKPFVCQLPRRHDLSVMPKTMNL